MDDLTRKIVERLFRDAEQFSRNRNFQTYDDTRVKRAARICKHLKNLEADLIRHGSRESVTLAAFRGEGAEMKVCLQIDSLGCQRTAFITSFELDLLRENQVIGSLLMSEGLE